MDMKNWYIERDETSTVWHPKRRRSISRKSEWRIRAVCIVCGKRLTMFATNQGRGSCDNCREHLRE